MRLFNLFLTALIVFGATSASAISFIATADQTTVAPGDIVTISLTLDASDLTTETTLGFAISLTDPGGAFGVVGGTQTDPIFQLEPIPGFLVGGIPLLSPLPPNNNLDPAVIRVGVWGSPSVLDPAGNDFGWGTEVIATVQIQANSVGIFDITPIFASGDGFELDGAQIQGTINSLVGTTITVVPEPGTALLMGLGLSGLSLAGRRQSRQS